MWMMRPIETKTYRQIREEIDPFPVSIDDDALKATVAMWFDARHVCDDEKFETFFKRQLLDDYSHYQQLLRIEAGIAQYDWLVQEYHEHKVDVVRTPDLMVSDQGGVNSTVTTTPAETTERHSGTDKHSANYSDEMAYASHDLAATGTSRTTTVTHPTKTVHTGFAEDRTHQGTSGEDNAELTKDNPMSVSYSGGITMSGYTNGDAGTSGSGGTVATLDWTAPSSQRETGSLKSEKYRDTGLATDNYSDEQTSYTGTDQTQVTESGGRDKTGKDTRTILGDKDSLLHGHVIAHETDTAGSVVTAETNGNLKTTTGTDTSVTKDRYTGRHEDPATILERSVQFIINTKAWDWLYKRLDTCFISVLDFEY